MSIAPHTPADLPRVTAGGGLTAAAAGQSS